MATKSLAIDREQRRLRRLLAGLWLVLLVPTLLLGYQTYQQLRFESLHQYRLLAENLSTELAAVLDDAVGVEEQRPPADYRYANQQPVSPLSRLETQSNLGGVVGYFQVDASGVLSSPLLPAPGADLGAVAGGLDMAAVAVRQSRFQALLQLLQPSEPPNSEYASHTAELNQSPQERPRQPQGNNAQGSLAEAEESLAAAPDIAVDSALDFDREASPKPAVASASKSAAGGKRDDAVSAQQRNQVLFEKLATNERKTRRHRSKSAPSAAAELDLQTEYFSRTAKSKVKKANRQAVVADAVKALPTDKDTAAAAMPYKAEVPSSANLPPSLFGAAVTGFELLPLSASHMVLFRRVWSSTQQQVQGLVLARLQFFDGLVTAAYQRSELAGIADLALALDGEVQFAIAADADDNSGRYATSTDVRGGELLYRRFLPAPFSEVELLYSARDLPLAAGGTLVVWTLVLLVGLLCAGFALLYHLGRRQLLQRQQQQDFVSAVSHELKTPLTSIRMYGEMLKSGWVADDKKPEYYDYIFNESERLSRLINNVLQLSNMSHASNDMQLHPLAVSQVIDLVESRASAQLSANGFTLDVQTAEPATTTAQALVNVDEDALLQVMINLIDNAIKFSHGQAERILLSASANDTEVTFSVRDFGPGIERDALDKIFELFYRSENELTRETVGTGIGLALVQELVAAMQGKVVAANCEPGAKFTVHLPRYVAS